MTKLTHKISALLILIMTTSGVMAAELPEYYPAEFERTGVISRIDTRNQEIVIYDSLMQLPPGTSVHSLTKQFAFAGELRKGMKIGYEIRRYNGKKAVAEIWVLPHDYDNSGGE